MADRDLLHKPIPLVAPEGEEQAHAIPAPQRGRLGVTERPREVGREADAQPGRNRSPAQGPQVPAGRAGATPKEVPGAAPAGEAAPAARPKAFRNAYFNKDTAATGAINQRTREMAALRGQEGAADLRKVVLPHPEGAENPSPERLHAALARMGDVEGLAHGFADLLGRQANWTKQQGVTPEAIAALQAKLEAMVAARRAALARFAALPPAHLDAAPTLGQALVSADVRAEAAPDAEAEAEALVSANVRRGEGLRARLAKVMGSKR